MVHAGMIAARYLAELPAEESPETTEGREGFYYIASVRGDCENAEVAMIVRDFVSEKNDARLQFLEQLREQYLERYPGLRIGLETRLQYQNMRDVLVKHPHVVELAARAIEDAGLPLLQKSIRGGTDGSLLCQLGHPTPNIFAGGLLFHSRREWVALSSLQKATEVIVHLGRRWTDVAVD